MATTILDSQNRIRTSPRPSRNPNIFHHRRHRNRWSSTSNKQSPRQSKPKVHAQNNLVIDQVKILRRGQAAPPSLIKRENTRNYEKLIEICSANVESDDVAFFAGSAFSVSPSPSVVPFPRFLAIDGNQTATLGLV